MSEEYRGMTATYSPEDNKIRISALSRLPKELYERVRAAGFIWAPKQEIFVAPMWTPWREDLALELCGEIGDEDTSLVDRAEQRAERFEEYSDSRRDDAERAKKAVDSIADGIPFGQPILVGHHSEKHARRDAEKIENGMRRAVQMWETSKYWKSRAAGAIHHAKYKELPAVRHRRIKGLESDLRREQKRKAEDERFLADWNHPNLSDEAAARITNYDHVSKCFLLAEYPRPEGASKYEGMMSLYSALRDKIITTAQAREIAVRVHERGLADAERWIQHISNRLEYERAMLAEDGGTAQGKFDPQAVVVGGRVLADNEWLIVLKVNKAGGVVNSVTTMAPRVVSWQKTWKYGIERIKDYRAPEAGEAEKVIAATKLPPLCNYPGEGFTQITKAEWDRKCSDYKGTRVIAATETAGRHRVRHGMFANYTQAFVYLTDVKRVDPPKPKASEEPAKLDRVYADVAETVVPRKREVDETAAGFDALKDSLKAGVKVVSAPQLFPTPPELAQRMVEEAQIRPGETVLEPSAGTGNLLKAIRKDAGDCVDLTAVEIDERLTDIVRMARKVHYGDFLQCNGDLGKFDRILMNPPFVNGDDIKHIQHAIKFLKPNGRLVAICAGGPRQQAVLQPLAENSGGIWEPLEPGTFKESGTMVNAVLLTIEG